ncbi:MAG: hypothetical protein QNJ60_19585 [Xenococcaceae cyanobacterium MO_188.B19]|nr:hypothetical protein [Xenococcaceae cyanobacterium MO_188.B19]
MKLKQKLINLFSGSKNSNKEIRKIFFDLIQKNQGYITVIDFAMAANLSGTDAKKTLEQFAVEFDATFEVTEKGHVLYLFPLINKSNSKKVAPQNETDVSVAQKNTKIANNKKANPEHTRAIPQETNSDLQSQNINSNKTQINNKENSSQNDEKSFYTEIHDDVKKKVEDIQKIEDDLKKFGKSMNDLFKF